ncbi:WD40-like Beta Propeller Repeat [Candidatus Electrothrix aarhusensis]|uniref:WD40-like Beta Propeller Repeat n=1 Tax=Candidatus Electrothrix aarhusensis TaxID=1859131 RepID=A0A3S3UD02_9BACT|nr:WD40-like Beta Propeller Repeat [Candidatus Electrothrix aarhusensis]
MSDMSFSPNGRILASAHASYEEVRNSSVRLWDCETGKEIAVFLEHNGDVDSISFSPDGNLLASTSFESGTIILRDMRAYTFFLQRAEPTSLYHTFIEAVKFLWQLDVQGLEIVKTKRRTPADLKKYGTLLAPPPPGQSKFDQVLEWAQQQQEK